MMKQGVSIKKTGQSTNMFFKRTHFNNMTFWDAKRYKDDYFVSPFEIEPLKNHIIEQNFKEKPFESPGKDFKILGVNNKTGLFDAYIKKGKKLKQPYKPVENGFLVPLPPFEIQRSIVLTIKKLKIQIKHLKRGAEQLRLEAIKMFEDELFCPVTRQ
jgi:hypothetical protein